VVDGERAAAGAQRLFEERAAAAADLEQDVVGPELKQLQQGAKAGPVVERVAVRLLRRAAGGPPRTAVGEPVAVAAAEEGREQLRGEPARELALVAADERVPSVHRRGQACPVAGQLELESDAGRGVRPLRGPPVERSSAVVRERDPGALELVAHDRASLVGRQRELDRRANGHTFVTVSHSRDGTWYGPQGRSPSQFQGSM
jgi:hypothetical protein